MYGNMQPAMQIIMVIMTILAFFVCALAVVMYVFQAIGLYSISHRRKLGTSGFAWVPILNYIKLGQITDDAILKKAGKKPHFRIFYPIVGVASMLVMTIGMLIVFGSVRLSPAGLEQLARGRFTVLLARGFMRISSETGYAIGIILICIAIILSLVWTVLQYICLYHIYRSCSSKWVPMFILSFIFSVLVPFFLFAVRRQDNPDVYPPAEPASETYTYGQA